MKSEKSKPGSKPLADAASQKPTPVAAPQPAPTAKPEPKPAPAPVSYPEVPTNNWIDAVIKNDSEFSGSILLHGYLGKSQDDSCVDLYSDAGLNKKVTIKKDNIIHVQKIQAANGSVEGSHVWVKKDGDYSYTDGANEAKARFLQGDIYSNYLQNTGIETAPAGIPTTTAAAACPTICGNLTDEKGAPANANTLLPTIMVCIPTLICGGQAPNAAPQNTAATVCTQVACPQTQLLGCTTATSTPDGNSSNNTVATVCTQIACPQTHLLGCNTATSKPTANNTIATVCTQIGCAPQTTPAPNTIWAPSGFGDCQTMAGWACLVNHNAEAPAPQTIGVTGWQGCTVVGPTGTQGCTIVGPTGTEGCTVVGPTGWHTCMAPTQLLGCGGATGTPTAMLGCQTATSTPTHLMGCTGVTATPAANANLSFPTLQCTIPAVCIVTALAGCNAANAQQVGPTGWHTCVAPTQLLGCQTATSTPTALLGCQTATSTPAANANLSFPTLQCTIPAVCIVTALAGCNAANAQQVGPTGWHTCVAPTHLLGCQTATSTPTALLGCQTATSTPTHLMGCTGVTSTPAANANLSFPTLQCTIPAVCIVTALAGCNAANAQQVGPTGWHTCMAPTHLLGCGGATGTPTAMLGCQTATSTPTHLLGCGGATGTPTALLGCQTATSTPAANANLSFPTLQCTIPAVCIVTALAGCNAANAQQVGPTGWHTCVAPTHLLGCQTATSTPTHLLGCGGATGTPTALLGCQTATSTPTHLMGCTGVTSTPEANAAHPLTSAPGVPTMNSFCIPTIVPFCMTTQPGQCPATLPAGCMPTGNEAANANAAAPQTIGVTGWLGCTPTSNPAHCLISVPANCPTVHNCPPAPNANAATPTLPVAACATQATTVVVPTLNCGIPSIPGCIPTAHCTGIPFIC